MYCSYYEMGFHLEGDFLKTVKDCKDWFVESYRFHTRRKPSEKAISRFLKGQSVIHTENHGEFESEWFMIGNQKETQND